MESSDTVGFVVIAGPKVEISIREPHPSAWTLLGCPPGRTLAAGSWEIVTEMLSYLQDSLIGSAFPGATDAAQELASGAGSTAPSGRLAEALGVICKLASQQRATVHISIPDHAVTSWSQLELFVEAVLQAAAASPTLSFSVTAYGIAHDPHQQTTSVHRRWGDQLRVLEVLDPPAPVGGPRQPQGGVIIEGVVL